MSLDRKTLGRRLLVGAAAMTLSLGVVSCSDAEDAAGTAGDALSSATDAAGSALDDATGGANASEESAEPGQGENGQDGAGENGAGGSGEEGSGGEGADGAGEGGTAGSGEEGSGGEGAGGDGAGGGETTEVESADGSTLTVPAAVVSVAEQAGFGAPTEVEEGSDGKTLVSYEEGFVVNSKEGGAQPLIGMIGETWISEGGLDAGVGVPTAPEEANPEGTGWVQEFSNGVVSWVNDGSGEFKADIQQN